MTNSDRYSPDDYNADQIDEDVVEHQGTDKTKRVAGKRKPKTSPKATRAGTAAARAKRTDSDQDKQKAGADATAKSVRAKSVRAKTKTATAKTATAKTATAKKPNAKKPNAKKPVTSKATTSKTAKKTATNRATSNRATSNRIAKTALSKETTMKALAQQELVANSVARRKALATMSLQKNLAPKDQRQKDLVTPLQKSAQTAGTGIVWTLLGIGLAACGGTSYVEKPVTKTVPGDPAGTTTDTPAGTTTDTPAGTTTDTPAGTTTDTPAGETELAGAARAEREVESGTEFFVGDGPIQGATVWIDNNNNGVVDEGDTQVMVGGEPLKTNEFGRFTLSEDIDPSTILIDITGGYDVGTDTLVTTSQTFRTIKGGTVFTPLTTLLRSLIDSATDDFTDPSAKDTARFAAQQTMIKALFGEDTEITISDLLNRDNYIPQEGNIKSKIISNKAIDLFTKLESVLENSGIEGDALAKIRGIVKGILDAAAFGINSDGEIWFRQSPNYESTKKSYDFTLVATTAGGQIQDSENITITIDDVDEAPTTMRLGKSSRDFSIQRDLSAGRKLTSIKFTDDGLGTNEVELQLTGNDVTNILGMFEIRPTVNRTFALWLSPRLNNITQGEYTINIVPTVSGVGRTPDPIAFTLNITPAVFSIRINRLDKDARAPSMLSQDGQTAFQTASEGDLAASGTFLIFHHHPAHNQYSLPLSVRSMSNETGAQNVDRNTTINDVLHGGKGKEIIGKFGTLYVKADGSWTYELDVDDVDTLALAHNEAAKDIFQATVTDSTNLRASNNLEIDVVGGHEAPARAEGTAAQQNLQFVEAGQPNYVANGQLTHGMFGVDDDTVTHVKITSMTLTTSSDAVRGGLSFYTPIPGVDAYIETSITDLSEKTPHLISVTDLVAQPTNKQLNVAIFRFNTNMNMSDLDNSNTQVRIKYKLVDQYGLESPEYETVFEFSTSSNEPPVEPSGTSSSQGRVGQYIAGEETMSLLPSNDFAMASMDII